MAPLLNGLPLVVIPARLDLSHSPSVSGRPQRCRQVQPSAERCDRPHPPNSRAQNLNRTALQARALKSQPTCLSINASCSKCSPSNLELGWGWRPGDPSHKLGTAACASSHPASRPWHPFRAEASLCSRGQTGRQRAALLQHTEILTTLEMKHYQLFTEWAEYEERMETKRFIAKTSCHLHTDTTGNWLHCICAYSILQIWVWVLDRVLRQIRGLWWIWQRGRSSSTWMERFG